MMLGVIGKMSSKLLLLFLFGLVLAAEARNLKNELSGDSAALDDVSLDTKTKSWSGKSLLKRRKRDASSSSMESAELDVSASELIKFFLKVGWNEDKLSVLSGFLEELVDSETNITVVGWQNIYHDAAMDDGVKEFKSIQFVVPPKPNTGEHNGEADKDTDNDDEEEDIDEDFGRLIPHTLVNKLREVFEPMEEMGIPASAIFEEYNKAGEPEVQIFLDKNTLWSNSEGFSVYNKTLVANQEDVDEFLKIIDTYKMKSVLKYDAAGRLNEGNSNVSPYFLGSVIDHYEATDDILLESPGIVANAYAKSSRAEVPRQLALLFNNKWPEWQWRVFVDPSYYHISKDISVTLSIDNLDFDETSDVSYFVYGRKLEGRSH